MNETNIIRLEQPEMSSKELQETDCQLSTFPFDALPEVVGKYAKELSDVLEVADSIAGSSALAVCSLLVQHKGNVITTFGETPLSLFLLTVAESGERKSTIEKLLLKPVEEKENSFYEDYEVEYEKSLDSLRIWEDKKDQALKDKNMPELNDLYENKPRLVEDPKILVTDPTISGLFDQYQVGRSSIGIFPNEGATIFGSHSFKHQSIATVGHLSNLWDGKPIERTRGGKNKKNIKLFNKRLTASFMVQPVIFDKVWESDLFQQQGILARFLICKPNPKTGTRTNIVERLDFEYKQQFYKRVNELLEKIEQPKKPIEIHLSPQANKANLDFYKSIEQESGPGKKYHSVRFFSSKIAEQARRMAGIICLFENSESELVSLEDMEKAVCLAKWYLDEVLRISKAEKSIEEEMQEEAVMRIIERREAVSTRDILRTVSIKSIRRLSMLQPILSRLEKNGKIFNQDNQWSLCS